MGQGQVARLPFEMRAETDAAQAGCLGLPSCLGRLHWSVRPPVSSKSNNRVSGRVDSVCCFLVRPSHPTIHHCSSCRGKNATRPILLIPRRKARNEDITGTQAVVSRSVQR